jgi:hypothetical protein
MSIVLQGRAYDIVDIKEFRKHARTNDKFVYDSLTHLLGEIDKKRGTKAYNENTVAFVTASELIAKFDNAAADPRIAGNEAVIKSYTTTAAFYRSLLPTPMKDWEIDLAIQDAKSEGCKQIKDYLDYLDKEYFGRYVRTNVIDKIKKIQAESK